MKTLEIYWNYPIKINSALISERCNKSWGIYYISRKFGGKETLLYVGLTFHQNFKHRINQHRKNWIKQFRGEKYVRFGEFVKPSNITKAIIEDAESGIIHQIQPTKNICKKRSYTYTEQYKISNTGFRGIIPKEISMSCH